MMNIIESIFGMNLQMEQQPRGPFKGKFHAYSPAFWNSEIRDKLEKGDKIVVPASVLEQVSRLQVSFPIMFRITSDSELLPKKSHCSVLEFTAEEGNVYLPLWMIDNLGLDPEGNSMVELETVNLPKGTFVQFQPHETKFAMLSNPRVVLEHALRSYSALTVGDTIPVHFGDATYKLDVTDVKPKQDNPLIPNAISIIETDINVDFKEPRDYKQWEKAQKEAKEQTQKQLQSSDSKYAEEEEDNSWVYDPTKNENKSGYFKELEQLGAKPNTLKRETSLRKNFSSNALSSKNTNNTTSSSSSSSSSSFSNSYSLPSRTRGAPLGSTANKVTSPVQTAKPTKGTRKEEEIVGNMRYIYEIDELGNRTCIRKLPVRNDSWMNSAGHTLQ